MGLIEIAIDWLYANIAQSILIELGFFMLFQDT